MIVIVEESKVFFEVSFGFLFDLIYRINFICCCDIDCDEDMTTFDIITIIAYAYLFEAISDKTHAIIYLCYPEQNYFTCFNFMPKCRLAKHLDESRSSLTSLLAQ